MIDKKYIDKVLDEVDLAEVVSDYGVKLQLRGHTAKGCCPFHQEDTPSFHVDTAKNLYHCFGCGKGGNVITFVMEQDGLTFPLAVKKLLKEKLHVDLSDSDLQSTPEEEERYKKLESMRIINERLRAYFCQEIEKDEPDAKLAKGYVLSRWNEDYCKEQHIGYAPNNWTSVIEFAKKEGLSLELMQEMGILKLSEKTHSLYCVYRNRIMIPICDRYSNIVGFTARAIDDKSDCKYLNSADSDLYCKSRSIFGINTAIKKARGDRKLYLVEGAPDVMKMQSVGIFNAIASLGGSWTESQFQKLKDYHLQDCTLCFIPDSDIPKQEEKIGAGFQNVLRNGALAIQQGFTVSVMEIPNDLTIEEPKKTDPDEFFHDKSDLYKLEEREYILWAFEKRLDKNGTTEAKQKIIEETSDLLILIKNEEIQERYLTQLAKMDSSKALWRQAINSAKMRRQKRQSEKNKEGGIDMLREFGFVVKHGCYYGYKKDGDEVQWSNFTLKPLFHIKDDIRPVRLFEIVNDVPDNNREIIELDMDAMTSARAFRKKLLGIGNYTWLAGEDALIQLQRYLARVTETAVEVKQLGWQSQGFFCFCNGALEESIWKPVDELGIVRLASGNYYLPAMSQLYKNSTVLYTNEKKYCHLTTSKISLHDYFARIIGVFGDNAKVGIGFYIATLFRDIVMGKSACLPLLNIFGPKGSGKTELAETLMSFFMTGNEPLNIETATVPALADAVASVSNMLVHVDEYKNGIDIKKVELMKDVWAGIGRYRMNMDKDKKREQSHVDSCIILTGQEIPTADIALFSRLIFLTYEKQHHTLEERDKFSELMQYRQMGATHITLEILKLRPTFIADFDKAWQKARIDLHSRTAAYKINDRIEKNWLFSLSAFLTIETEIDCPFCYEELLDICVKGAIRQNEMISRTDEVAGFWDIISSAQQKGSIVYGQDYVIKPKTTIKTYETKNTIDFGMPKDILMIRKNSMLTTYRQLGRQVDERMLPSESMLHYLQNSPEYLGISFSPERFKQFNANGQPIQEYVEKENKYKTVYQQDRPLCFDYQMIHERFGICLDSIVGDLPIEKETNAEEEALPF